VSASVFSTIGVIGAGAWGTALALAASRAGREVILWARDGATVDAIKTRREAPRLPGIALPQSITPTTALMDVAACRTLIVAVPTQTQREVLDALALVLPPGKPVISAAKGIERSTGQFVTEVILDSCPGAVPAILSGPSFAEDVARGLPTAVTLAAQDPFLAQALAEALSSPAFRIYHGSDVRGVEIGGAAKNVLAIAAGITVGLQLGESARAALVARGFAEIRRFAAAYGAQADTLMGLSGLGDLVLTCGSTQSRNFAFGQALGQGKSLVEASGGKLTEGAFTAKVLSDMASARAIDMPIAAGISAILAGRAGVREAVAELLARPVKAEG
jgi:glycerol-3-phosphate dehydrogenase (NAD(P)+)